MASHVSLRTDDEKEHPMKLPQSGGCLCGAVRYESKQAPNRTWTCHCMQCQRLTGSAFSIAMAFPAEGFEIRGGELRPVDITSDSGRVRTNWVCAQCGTWISVGSDPKLAPIKPNRVVL